MADQEFLASFGVEVDEAGVTRLQNVLSQNKELADQVAASFAATAEAVRSYQKAVTEGDNPTGEGTRDDGTGKEPAGGTKTGTEGSNEGGRDDGSRSEAWKNYQANKDKWENSAAGHESRDLTELKKQENTFLPSVKNEIESRLMGSLAGEEGTTRDWYLGNLEEYARATITKDSSRLKDTLLSWEEYGLSSNPAESERSGEYGALQTQANEILREPVSQARQIMQQALEAEANGEDTSGYADQIVELMKEPLQKVQELYDSFDFEDDPDYDENRNKDNGWKDPVTEDGEKPDTGHDEEYDPSQWKWNGEGWEEGAEEITPELDLSDAEDELEEFKSSAKEPVDLQSEIDLSDAEDKINSFKSDAEQPVELQAGTSDMLSQARTAYNEIKSIFSTPIQIKTQYSTNGSGGGTGGGNNQRLKQSLGGRFTRPTDVQVAEDGDAEYIIPVKKPARAVPLLRQMLSELSPDVRASLDLGIAGSEIVSGAPAAGSAGTSTVTMNSQNVSAPVTIQVRATGANAENIGQKLYDTTEKYLLRTLEGVFV